MPRFKDPNGSLSVIGETAGGAAGTLITFKTWGGGSGETRDGFSRFVNGAGGGYARGTFTLGKDQVLTIIVGSGAPGAQSSGGTSGATLTAAPWGGGGNGSISRSGGLTGGPGAGYSGVFVGTTAIPGAALTIAGAAGGSYSDNIPGKPGGGTSAAPSGFTSATEFNSGGSQEYPGRITPGREVTTAQYVAVVVDSQVHGGPLRGGDGVPWDSGTDRPSPGGGGGWMGGAAGGPSLSGAGGSGFVRVDASTAENVRGGPTVTAARIDDADYPSSGVGYGATAPGNYTNPPLSGGNGAVVIIDKTGTTTYTTPGKYTYTVP